MAWCRRKLPDVGDVIRCPREGLEKPLVVIGVRQAGKRTVRRNFIPGDLKAHRILLEGFRAWTVFECCEVER